MPSGARSGYLVPRVLLITGSGFETLMARSQQLPRLRRVGVVDHIRHHRTIRSKALAAASAAATWPGNDPAVAY
jgi:hypothetical protein